MIREPLDTPDDFLDDDRDGSGVIRIIAIALIVVFAIAVFLIFGVKP